MSGDSCETGTHTVLWWRFYVDFTALTLAGLAGPAVVVWLVFCHLEQMDKLMSFLRSRLCEVQVGGFEKIKEIIETETERVCEKERESERESERV